MCDKISSFYLFNLKYKLQITRKNPSVHWFLQNVFSAKHVMYNDRFGLLEVEPEWNYVPLNEGFHEMKNLPYLPLEEICANRAEELIKLAHTLDKEIYISWSGGVDSTLVICSFLKLGYKDFHVLYNKNSVKEYPFFFQHLQKIGIKLHDFNVDINLLEGIPKNNLVVNGMCGDKMDAHSTVDMLKFCKNAKDYKDGVKQICHRFGYTDYDYYISSFETYIKNSQLSIKTFADFAWLFEFGFEWRRAANIRKILSQYPDRRISYFDTKPFERYALESFYLKRGGSCFSGVNYKNDMKKYILKYTKNEDYFITKGKDAKVWLINPDNTMVIESNNSRVYKKIYNGKEFVETLKHYFKDEYKEFVSYEENTSNITIDSEVFYRDKDLY